MNAARARRALTAHWVHQAFRHLITALPHLPDDYWSYHELGTGLKLLADRLDVAEEAIGALEDATRFCDRARWMLPKLQEGVVSEVMQKVLYLHCCDIYDSWALDKPEKQQECAEEAVAIKLFPSRWQRPAKFFVPDLETKPWWDIEEVIGGFADGCAEPCRQLHFNCAVQLLTALGTWQVSRDGRRPGKGVAGF
jgi:hypothetical protein